MSHLRTPTRFRWPAAALVLSGLLLMSIAIAFAGDHGWWDSTEVQILNLDPVPAPFTARFIGPAGNEVYSFSDTLPPLGTRFYRPEDMQPPLPAGFSGMLAVDSAQNVAATILHHDEPGTPLLDGNTTFDVVDTALDTDPIHFPVDVCTIVVIHNADPHAAATTTSIFDEGGVPLLIEPRLVESDTTTVLILGTLLPALTAGGGVIETDTPIEVTILHSCAGLIGGASYSPVDAPATHWLAPRFLPGGLGQEGTSFIGLKNASFTSVVSVTLHCPCGSTATYVLAPNAGRWVMGPPGAVEGPLYITGSGPIMAQILTQYGLGKNAQEPPGDYLYPAASPDQATRAVALPVLLRGYEGWTTDSGLYIQNLGAGYAKMHLRYVTTEGVEYYDEALIAPDMVWTPLPPPIAFQHAAAIAWADQPISALVTARKQGVLDGWMGYRGINYQLPPPPDASFSAQPPDGCAPLAVQLTDTSLGSPTAWRWDFGDGMTSTLQHPAHTYPEAGVYTMTLTAMNYASGDTATGSVAVYDRPLAAFTYPGGPLHAGRPVPFVDTSTPPPSAWHWDFGDGATYTVPNPVHTFTGGGTFDVHLTVTSTLGCAGSTSRSVIVLPPGHWRTYLPIVVKSG